MNNVIKEFKHISNKVLCKNKPFYQQMLFYIKHDCHEIKPFWNSKIKKLSDSLWLPNVNEKTVSKQFYNEVVGNYKIKDNVNYKYSRKIRFYPNKHQIKLFQKCFGASRFIYNRGIEKLHNEWKTILDKAKMNGCLECNKKLRTKLFCKEHSDLKPEINFPLSLSKLRPMLMKSDKSLNDNEKWLKDVPYDTRQLVIRELIGNIKACLTNKSKGNIKFFKMTYRTKKDDKQIFHVDKRAIENLSIFKRRLKFKRNITVKTKKGKKKRKKIVSNKSKLYVRSKYKKYYNFKPTGNCIILKDNYNWYLLIPKDGNKEHKKSKYSSCSLDPGVRTFQTIYSPDGIIKKSELNDKINLLHKKIDLLKSLRSKTKSERTKNNIDLRCFKLRTKIKNSVNDLHWKLSNYLVKNYHLILLPTFHSQKMVKKRLLNQKVNRMFMTLSHFKFKMKLKHQCNKWQRELRIVDESYTSKTCGRCGKINHKLGSSKIYNCPSCKLKIDRDVNGARNIYLKNIGLDESL